MSDRPEAAYARCDKCGQEHFIHQACEKPVEEAPPLGVHVTERAGSKEKIG